MTLRNLTEAESQIVFECLRCVASGEVILNDWEFHTLFGIEFDVLKRIVAALPSINESDEKVQLAINNTLNNLLGYPHGRHDRWGNYISVTQAEVARIFAKWRGDPVENYFDGMR